MGTVMCACNSGWGGGGGGGRRAGRREEAGRWLVLPKQTVKDPVSENKVGRVTEGCVRSQPPASTHLSSYIHVHTHLHHM